MNFETRQKIYLDRDYIQDKDGDIYQVIGSYHPPGKVIALQKYKRVDKNQEIETHKNLIPSNDPISKVKSHSFQYWEQRGTNDLFVRILPNYSSESAKNNMAKHQYQSFSSIFQMDLLQIPIEEVQTHFIPENRVSNIFEIFQSGTFEHKKNLENLEREAIEVIQSLSDLYKIPNTAFGITGSILWNAQHKNSDIDLMIYGWQNTQKILQKGKFLSAEAHGLRSYLKIEILPLAEKMAIKTGLPMEECFEYIYYKPYMFFHNQRKVSVTFAPTFEELVKHPFFIPTTEFHNQPNTLPCIIKAKIQSSNWGYFYPGIFEIKCEEIIQVDPEIHLPAATLRNSITRLVVYEHELIGFFKTGEIVEIKGLIQRGSNVPSFQDLTPIETYQIFLGGYETFGKEYIRKID